MGWKWRVGMSPVLLASFQLVLFISLIPHLNQHSNQILQVPNFFRILPTWLLSGLFFFPSVTSQVWLPFLLYIFSIPSEAHLELWWELTFRDGPFPICVCVEGMEGGDGGGRFYHHCYTFLMISLSFLDIKEVNVQRGTPCCSLGKVSGEWRISI